MEASAAKEQVKVRRKPEAVRDWLETLTRRLGPGARLPKAAQLCQELGISANTLDRALRELEGKGVITRRHGVGIFVAQHSEFQSKRIFLICHPGFFSSGTYSPFWDFLIKRVLERATVAGDSVEFHFTRPDNEEPSLSETLQKEIRERRVDGVLAIGLSNEAILFLEEHVPCVSFAGWSNYRVSLDLKAEAQIAVKALADNGCQRIAAWLGLPTTRQYDLRLIHVRERVAFRGALRRCGVNFDSKMWRDSRDVLAKSGRELSQQEQGYELAHYIWKEKVALPDGIMFFDDTFARGALTALTSLGVQIGADVQIATHANAHSDVLLGYENSVNRVEFVPGELADLMFSQLEALMQGQQVPRVTVNTKPRLVQPQPRVAL